MQDEQQGLARRNVARRGILAAASAMVAGLLAKASERVAGATDGAALIVGQNNTGTAKTILTHTPSLSTFQAFSIDSSVTCLQANTSTGSFDALAITHLGSGTGVSSSTQGGIGLFGGSNTNSGVRGQTGTTDPLIAAVTGQANSTTGSGVRGDAGSGVGVRGNTGRMSAAPGIGVLGVAAANATALAVPAQPAGLYGLSNSTVPGVVGQSNGGVGCQGSSNGNVGVLGTSSASHALYGSSINGYGLYATSTNSTGIVSSTNSGNAIQGASNGNVGVLGTSQSGIGGYFSSGSSTGLYATGPAAGFAARFDGPVLVNGNFTAIGGSKSAAVPHPDGTHRRLYCVEAPESWFEDFGQDQIVNGRGRVQLDPDFDALVRGDHYQVFLTPYGDTKGLYVSDRRPHGFDVREQQGGTSNVAFGYRVVAKRKDIAGPRLERVDLPGAPPRPPAPQAPPPIPTLEAPRLAPTAAAAEPGRP